MLTSKDKILPPLFICGFPSGGTDLLKTILNAHPDIYINGEMPFLYYLSKYGYHSNTLFFDSNELNTFNKYLRKYDMWRNIENINDSIDLTNRNSITLAEVLRRWFNSTKCAIWGNKTPQNSENINNLNILFPDAKFILIIRDIRDICLSWKNKWGKNIYLCSSKWDQRMNKAANFLESLPKNRYLIIKYEDLLCDTMKITKDITNFLEIEWSERLINHHLYTTKIIDGKKNYGKKIDITNKNKWEKCFNRKQILNIENYAFRSMNRFKYLPKYSTQHKVLPLYRKLCGVFQDFFATLIVGNRLSNQNKLIDRFNAFYSEIVKLKLLVK